MTTINEKQTMTIWDELYEKALAGIPAVSKPVIELANDYLIKNNGDVELAAKELANYLSKLSNFTGFNPQIHFFINICSRI